MQTKQSNFSNSTAKEPENPQKLHIPLTNPEKTSLEELDSSPKLNSTPNSKCLTPTAMTLKYKDLNLHLPQLSPFSQAGFLPYSVKERDVIATEGSVFENRGLSSTTKHRRKITLLGDINSELPEFEDIKGHRKSSSFFPQLNSAKQLNTEPVPLEPANEPKVLVVNASEDFNTKSALDQINELLRSARIQRNKPMTHFFKKKDEERRPSILNKTGKHKATSSHAHFDQLVLMQPLKPPESIKTQKVVEGFKGLIDPKVKPEIRVAKPPKMTSKKSLSTLSKIDLGPDPEIEKAEKAKKEAKKAKMKKKVRCFLWTYAISRYFYIFAKGKAIERDLARQHKAVTSIAGAETEIENFFIAAAGKEIKAMFNDMRHNYDFMAMKSLTNVLKLRVMAETLENHIFAVFDKMISQVPKMNPNILEYFHSVCEDGSYLPSDYFTEYELKRLPINKRGVLQEPKEWQSKFIIIVIVMVRIFLLKILPNATKDTKKYLNIGSFIYICVNELVRSNVQLLRKNLDELLDNSRLKVREGFKVQENIDVTVDPKNEMILGFYTKADLIFVFKQRRSLFDRVRVSIAGWIEAFYTTIHGAWLQQAREAGAVKKGALLLF